MSHCRLFLLIQEFLARFIWPDDWTPDQEAVNNFNVKISELFSRRWYELGFRYVMTFCKMIAKWRAVLFQWLQRFQEIIDASDCISVISVPFVFNAWDSSLFNQRKYSNTIHHHSERVAFCCSFARSKCLLSDEEKRRCIVQVPKGCVKWWTDFFNLN